MLACGTGRPVVFDDNLFLFLFLNFDLVCVLLRGGSATHVLFMALFSCCFCCGDDNFCFFLLKIIAIASFLLTKHVTGARAR